MLITLLLAAHIAVLGYWLGADLCINSTFRFVSRASAMPYTERNRLMEHVLDIDQHVRYALILQIGLGTALAALFGYLPGGTVLAAIAGMVALAWLALVELTHRRRHQPAGIVLSKADQGIRYFAVALALLAGAAALTGHLDLSGWLAIKLLLFAGVIVSGIGIRIELRKYFRIWQEIGAAGSTPERELLLWRRYISATSVLVILWLCVTGIALLSVFKPL